MTFQLKAEILLANSNWEKNLRKSSKQLDSFGKQMKTVANGVKSAWAGIGVLAFGAVGDAIVDVTKKFQEDEQSQRILAKVIDNNVKGHQKLKTTVEDNISSWSLMSAIQDDKIRPAYSYLIRATKDITKSNKLMKIALDLAAGAHIDIGAAASALGRAFNGNLKALDKLAPGIKKLKDPIGEVGKRFEGLAKLAADNDPFAKLQIVMDEFKEKLGKAFLPVMKKFADYMSSPEFQKGLEDIALKVQKFGEWFTSKEGQKTFKQWMDDLKTMIKLAGDFLDLVGNVAKLLKFGHTTGKNAPSMKTDFRNPQSVQQALSGGTNTGNFSTIGQKITMNITVNGVASGKDVVTELSKLAIKKGIPLSKLLK